MRSFSWLTLVSLACFTVSVHAQLPGAVPPGSAAAATTAAGAANNVGAPQMGFCAKCLQACEDCKRRLCATPLGAMLNNMTKPLSAMSGGIIPSFCPEKPSAEELAKPGSEGAANNIKKDAVEAKARRAAVRYMGTVDCRYYPEAEGALIAALRTDGIECVRWEAALVLGKGCCCSKKIIEALTHAVSCSEKDGNPAERSERVRFAACLALERCLACYSEPVEDKKDLKPVEPGKTPTEDKTKTGTPPQSSRAPDRQTILEARAAIKKLHDRYGLDASNQISVVMEEAVKLSPVPAQGTTVTQPVVTSPMQQAPVKMSPTPVTTAPTAAATPKREPRSLFSVLRGDPAPAPMTQIINVQPMQTMPMQPTTTQPVSVQPMSVPVKPMTIQPMTMPPQTMSPTPAHAIINAAPQPKEARPMFQYTPSQPVLPDLSKVEVKETSRPVFNYIPAQPTLPDLSKAGEGK